MEICEYNFLFIIMILNSMTLMYLEFIAAAAAAKSLQSCPTLCSPIDGSPPGSPIPGILQATGKNTEVVCHAFFQGTFQPRD